MSNYKELLRKRCFHLKSGCRYKIEAIDLGLRNKNVLEE